MKEHEIRPLDLEFEASRLSQSDKRRLLKYKDRFVEVNCPACGSISADVKFHKKGFDFWECNHCETLFISPRPSAEMLSDYYATAESLRFWNRCLFPASATVRKEHIFRPRVDLVSRLVEQKPVGTLVDVGAGFGWFTSVCLEEGLARCLVAVEPNPELAASCRNVPSVEVIEKPIEACYDTLHADVITCFELVEHIYEPHDFLSACFQGLQAGGIFICTTPNWVGFDLSLLQDRSDNVSGPNHLQLFTPSSLSLLLSKVGFTQITITTPGQLDVDILRNKMIAGILEPGDLPFFGPLIRNGSEEFLQDLQSFLQRHGLSSNMMAVAKKSGK